MTTDRTTSSSWDTGRRREYGRLLAAIAADADRLADEHDDREVRRVLREASRDAADLAGKIAGGPGPSPGDPRRLAEAGFELEATADPRAAPIGHDLIRAALGLQTFYTPGAGGPRGDETGSETRRSAP